MLTTTARTAALTLAAVALAGTAAAETITLSEGDNIQAAIIGAADGDTIVLEPGVYQQTFTVTNKVLTIRGTDPANPDVVAATVVDGLGVLGTVVQVEGLGSAGSKLEGLSITGGNATVGGGVRAVNASGLTISDCVLHGNVVEGVNARGGALHTAGTFMLIERTTFTGNQALGEGSDGGAVFIDGLSGLARDCSFVGNFAQDSGGAVRKDNGGTFEFTNCTFEGNEAILAGGAIFIRLTASIEAEACRFFGNICPQGAALAVWPDAGQGTVRNCVFQENVGSTLLNKQDEMHVRSCTFVGNREGAVVAEWAPTDVTTVYNCAFAGNDDAIIAAGGLDLRYSLLEVDFGGIGNIFATATFVDADGPDDDPLTFADNDLRPAADSPAIDAGSTALYCGPLADGAGSARGTAHPDTPDTGESSFGPVIDMGAYEFQLTADDPVDTCPQDVNGDGMVDVADLVEVILAWGICN